MKTLRHRYHQAHKEALFSILLALAYFAWWYGFSYGLAPNEITSPTLDLYFGFPLWFLMSCIIGPIVFTLLCGLLVKFCFKDMPLDIMDKEDHE